MTYSYTDPDGDRLEVVPLEGAGAFGLRTHDISDDETTLIAVKAAALPDLVDAMYRAAGLRPPFLLDLDRVADDWINVTPKGGA